jgi:protein-tyrosine-phosphatase
VLGLGTGSSCRRDIGKGIARAVTGELVNVRSTIPQSTGSVHPLTVRVMPEIGADISGRRSKPLTEFLEQPDHPAITVCGKADQAYPVFPGRVNRHIPSRSDLQFECGETVGGFAREPAGGWSRRVLLVWSVAVGLIKSQCVRARCVFRGARERAVVFRRPIPCATAAKSPDLTGNSGR